MVDRGKSIMRRRPQYVKAIRKSLWLTAFFVIVFASSSKAERVVGGCSALPPPATKNYRVPVGEKLFYDIFFMGMKRGNARFTTGKTKSGFWIKSKGRLKLDGFFHWIDDLSGRMVSYLRPQDGRPGRMFNHVYRGKNSEIRESAIFAGRNEVKGTLLYKGRKRPARIEGSSDIMDVLSIIYYLRSRRFKAKDNFCFEVYHRRRLWRIEGQMQGRAQVDVAGGKGEALVIDATFRRLGGGKAQGQENSVTAWLSADSQQLPLRLTSSIGFGELRVDLVDYRISKATK